MDTKKIACELVDELIGSVMFTYNKENSSDTDCKTIQQVNESEKIVTEENNNNVKEESIKDTDNTSENSIANNYYSADSLESMEYHMKCESAENTNFNTNKNSQKHVRFSNALNKKTNKNVLSTLNKTNFYTNFAWFMGGFFVGITSISLCQRLSRK